MLNNVPVIVRALAYERAHPKTKLSEFENDLEFVSREELELQVMELRQWVLELIASGGYPITPGGNLFGDSITSTLPIGRKIDAANITERDLPIYLGFYGGNVLDRVEA